MIAEFNTRKMSNELISSLKQTAESITSTRRPWTEFFDLSATSIPYSLSDTTTRVAQNLTRFSANYIIILLVLLTLTLITRPISLVAFGVVLLAWFFLYFAREEPLSIFGLAVHEGVVVAVLVGLTIASLVSTGVWSKAIWAFGLGIVIVMLHTVMRGTEDFVTDDLESPYGRMLSAEEDHSSRGDYSGI